MNAQPQSHLNIVVAAPDVLARFPELNGNTILVSQQVVDSGVLTSSLVVELEVGFREDNKDCLKRDLPNVAPARLVNLDSRGLVKPGIVVNKDDYLVGRESTKESSDMTPEEKLLHAIFGRSGSDVRDNSLVYPFRDPGEVSEIEVLSQHRGNCPGCGVVPISDDQTRECIYCHKQLEDIQQDELPDGITTLVKVRIAIQRELREGDLLQDEEGKIYVLAKILPLSAMSPPGSLTPAEVYVHPDSGLRSGSQEITKVPLQLEEKIQFRGTGPYDFNTQLPSTEPDDVPAVMISRDIASSLFRQGYRTNLLELFTIKSDAGEGRTQLYESLINGQPLSKTYVPTCTKRLQFLSCAACLDISWPEEQISVSEFSCDLATPDVVRLWSSGEVTSGDTRNEKTKRAQKGGLFCETIFGPERDWECACGKYRGMKYKGTTCERCGVFVTHRRIRSERMGHIELTYPVVHPWFVKSGALAELLGMEQQELERIVYYQCVVVTEQIKGGPALGTIIDRRDLKDFELTSGKLPFVIGGDGVRKLLELRGLSEWSGVILDCLPVLPPGFRDLEEDSTSAFRDLNILYRRFLARENRIRKLDDLEAPDVVMFCERRNDQQAADTIFDNLAKPRPTRTKGDRPEDSLREMLAESTAALYAKPVDFTARGIVIPDSELEPNQIGIPEMAVLELYSPKLLRKIKERGLADTIKAAKRYLRKNADAGTFDKELCDAAMGDCPVLIITEEHKATSLVPVVVKGEALRIHPDKGKKLGIRFAGEKLIVMVPLTKPAIDEIAKPKPIRDVASNVLNWTPELLVESITSRKPLVLSAFDQVVLGLANDLENAPVP